MIYRYDVPEDGYMLESVDGEYVTYKKYALLLAENEILSNNYDKANMRCCRMLDENRHLIAENIRKDTALTEIAELGGDILSVTIAKEALPTASAKQNKPATYEQGFEDGMLSYKHNIHCGRYHHPDCNYWKWDWRNSWDATDCNCDEVAGPVEPASTERDIGQEILDGLKECKAAADKGQK